MHPNESRQESRVRSLAVRNGYRVRRSRRVIDDHNNFGGFMLFDDCGIPVVGNNYDADLDEIEAWLRD